MPETDNNIILLPLTSKYYYTTKTFIKTKIENAWFGMATGRQIMHLLLHRTSSIISLFFILCLLNQKSRGPELSTLQRPPAGCSDCRIPKGKQVLR